MKNTTKQPNQYSNYSILDSKGYMSKREVSRLTGVPIRTFVRWLNATPNSLKDNKLEQILPQLKGALDAKQVTRVAFMASNKGYNIDSQFIASVFEAGIESFIHAKCGKTQTLEQVQSHFADEFTNTDEKQGAHESNKKYVSAHNIVSRFGICST